MTHDDEEFGAFVERHATLGFALIISAMIVRKMRTPWVAPVILAASAAWICYPVTSDLLSPIITRAVRVPIDTLVLAYFSFAALAIGQHLHRWPWWRLLWSSPYAKVSCVAGIALSLSGAIWLEHLEAYWKLSQMLQGNTTDNPWEAWVLAGYALSLVAAAQFARVREPQLPEALVPLQAVRDMVDDWLRDADDQSPFPPKNANDTDYRALLTAYYRYGEAIDNFLTVPANILDSYTYWDGPSLIEVLDRMNSRAHHVDPAPDLRTSKERETAINTVLQTLTQDLSDKPTPRAERLVALRALRSRRWNVGEHDCTAIMHALLDLGILVLSASRGDDLRKAGFVFSPDFAFSARAHFARVLNNVVAIRVTPKGLVVDVPLPAMMSMMNSNVAARFPVCTWRSIPELAVLFGDIPTVSLRARYLGYSRDATQGGFSADRIVEDALILALRSADPRFAWAVMRCAAAWWGTCGRTMTGADGASVVPQTTLLGLQQMLACILDVRANDTNTLRAGIAGLPPSSRRDQRAYENRRWDRVFDSPTVARFFRAIDIWEIAATTLVTFRRQEGVDAPSGLLALSPDGRFLNYERELRQQCGPAFKYASPVAQRMLRALIFWKHQEDNRQYNVRQKPSSNVVPPDPLGAQLHDLTIPLTALFRLFWLISKRARRHSKSA